MIGILTAVALATAPSGNNCKCKIPKPKAKASTHTAAVQAVKQPDPAPMKYTPPARTSPWLGIGGRIAAGGYTCAPYVFGLVGVRVKSPKLHLGLDISSQFSYGLGVSALVYPFVGETISWHLNAGILGFGTSRFAGNVKRDLDFMFGTGLEARLPVEWLSITADWRAAWAPEVYFGNALLRSQFMLGIMAHTW